LYRFIPFQVLKTRAYKVSEIFTQNPVIHVTKILGLDFELRILYNNSDMEKPIRRKYRAKKRPPKISDSLKIYFVISFLKISVSS
jgi:hypothetical protein